MSYERIVVSGTADTELAGKVASAFDRAKAGEGKVSAELLKLDGMSGKKYRLFINNLVESVAEPRYLEIGSWSGSTLCSAIYKNPNVRATAIDNWSEFGGPTNTFFLNVGRFISPKTSLSVICSNFQSVAYETLGKFNIYLFDGPHTRKDQYDGVHLVQAALDDEFVLVVDDWNWLAVRGGTRDALAANNCAILYSVEVFSTEGNVHPLKVGLPAKADSDWHNGYFIAVIKKGGG